MGRSFLAKMLLGFGLAGGSSVAVLVGVVSLAGTWSRSSPGATADSVCLGICCPAWSRVVPSDQSGSATRALFGMSFLVLLQHFSSFSHYREVSEPTMLRRVEKSKGS